MPPTLYLCILRAILSIIYGISTALIKNVQTAIYKYIMEVIIVVKKKRKQSKDIEIKPISKPENIIICEMIVQQGRHWEISDGTKAELGKWYRSKRGHLVLLEELVEDGSIIARSHFTGNPVKVPANQVLYFTPAEDPGTPCGIIMMENKEDEDNSPKEIIKYNNIYNKYPHIIIGSVYRMQNISTKDNTPQWERKRKGKKLQIKGQVRCKIRCQEPGCNNERDIKVQDAFQVRKCESCRDKKKTRNLKKFLNRKKVKE